MNTQCNVLPNRQKLTETEYRHIQGVSLRRLELAHGQQRVALEAGTEARTIRNARDALATMRGDFLFNLLDLDKSALDELLAHFNLKAVSIDANEAAEADLLADTLALASAHAQALRDKRSPGYVDAREESVLTKLARPVATAWAGRVARLDAKKAAA